MSCLHRFFDFTSFVLVTLVRFGFQKQLDVMVLRPASWRRANAADIQHGALPSRKRVFFILFYCAVVLPRFGGISIGCDLFLRVFVWCTIKTHTDSTNTHA